VIRNNHQKGDEPVGLRRQDQLPFAVEVKRGAPRRPNPALSSANCGDRIARKSRDQGKNLLSIFLRPELEHGEFDASLLATFNSFGFLRGKLAHDSIKTHQPIDPKTTRQIQKHILPELRKLDLKISRLY
jgi:hypothetical protein